MKQGVFVFVNTPCFYVSKIKRSFLSDSLVSSPRSVICFLVKPSVDIVCLDNVDEGFRVDLVYFFDQKFGFLRGNNGVDHAGLFVCVASGSLKAGSRVMRQPEDLLINFGRLFGDDKKRMFFVTLMKHLDDLRGSKLEDDGVQRSVPAEQQSGDQ